MIPRPVLAAWRRVVPWRDDLQVEQDLLLSRLAIEVATHPSTAETLVWRGGTCLHKLHLPTPRRYSEDLDYALLGDADHGEVARALEEIAHHVGFESVRVAVTSTRVNVSASAGATAGGTLAVKFEVNCADVPPLYDLQRLPLQVSTRWWDGAADVLTFHPSELVATKFRALAQRRKGRDLSDLWLARHELPIVDEELAEAADYYLRNETPPITPGALRVQLAGHVQDPDFVRDLDVLAATPYEGFDALTETYRLILWADSRLDPLFNARRSRNAVRRDELRAAKQGWQSGKVRCPAYHVTDGNLSRCTTWLESGERCNTHPDLPTPA